MPGIIFYKKTAKIPRNSANSRENPCAVISSGIYYHADTEVTEIGAK